MKIPSHDFDNKFDEMLFLLAVKNENDRFRLAIRRAEALGPYRQIAFRTAVMYYQKPLYKLPTWLLQCQVDSYRSAYRIAGNNKHHS